MRLVVRVERPLPPSLPVGSASAVWVIGACFAPGETIAGLEIELDGAPVAAAAFPMPRPDIAASLPGAPRRCGFWATVPVSARAQPGTATLSVAARLSSGAILRAPLGEIAIVDGTAADQRPASSATPGLIAVCMATFEPDLDLFEEQVRSLRAQSDSDWTCVISDDCSAPDRFEQIRAVVGDDPRFRVSRSDRRLGFYRNFERAIGLAPPETELFALADQDDVWHPDKLAVLRAALDGGTMAFSDLRLVDSAGRVFRATLWRGRRCNHTNLASMLVANSVTGAAMLFRREVAELALPFPDTPGLQFHDHWLAVVALSAGDVAYVERPLYDYVQHAGAVFGDVTHGARHRPPPPLERWRGAYFYGYLAREVQAQTLLLRCVGRLTPRKRRALQAFVDAQRSLPAFLWLAVRPLRAVVGRTETLGSETELAAGIIWKWLIGRLGRGDASFPPPTSFSQKRLRRWRASLAVGTRRRRATR